MPVSCLRDAISREREFSGMCSGFTEAGCKDSEAKFEASLGHAGKIVQQGGEKVTGSIRDLGDEFPYCSLEGLA